MHQTYPTPEPSPLRPLSRVERIGMAVGLRKIAIWLVKLADRLNPENRTVGILTGVHDMGRVAESWQKAKVFHEHQLAEKDQIIRQKDEEIERLRATDNLDTCIHLHCTLPPINYVFSESQII